MEDRVIHESHVDADAPAAGQPDVERHLVAEAVLGGARDAVGQDVEADVDDRSFDAAAGDAADDLVAIEGHRCSDCAGCAAVDRDGGGDGDAMRSCIRSCCDEAIGDLEHVPSVPRTDFGGVTRAIGKKRTGKNCRE